jgi:predicted CXXCH cytochrome family protein
MRKKIAALHIGLAVLVSMLMIGFAHSEEGTGILTDSGFQDMQRPPAVFSHDEHNEKAAIDECSVCHHAYADGKKLTDESSEGEECSECHKLRASDGVRPLMKAYHDMCKGCHQNAKASEGNRGPVTCGECHPRSR